MIKKKQDIENKIASVRKMIEELSSDEKKIVSDRLLSYLLFNELNDEKKPGFNPNEKPAAKTTLDEKELQLIKDLAKQTEKLRDLLGDDPYFFM